MKTENLKNAYEAIKNGLIIDCNGCRIWAGPMCYRGGEPYDYCLVVTENYEPRDKKPYTRRKYIGYDRITYINEIVEE